MLTNIITPGDKLEITKNMSEEKRRQLEEEKSVFAGVLVSQVFDVVDDTKLKIAMPIVEGKLIPLAVNARFNVCFYTKGGLYKSSFIVVSRYKQGSIYGMEVELIQPVKKFQRRQYYRLECMIDIEYLCVDEEFLSQEWDDDDVKKKFQTEGSSQGTVLDISGGGIRFSSAEQLEKGSIVLVKLNIRVSEDKSVYGVLGKVLESRIIRNGTGLYEQRLEYQDISGQNRETIIRYIFEQERRLRKK